jgi:MFS family permease
MKDSLHFDQQFIGNLGALSSAASIVGGIAYLPMSRYMSLRSLLYFSMVTGALATLSTFYLVDRESAIILTAAGGVVNMIALIAGLTMAAEYCPKGAESFTYAVLMSCHNLCNPISELSGGLLYDSVFNDPSLTIFQRLAPLIYISAACTLVPFLIMPFLKFDKKQR